MVNTVRFLERLRHQEVETPVEVRNVLLVIATLIAAVTFQAGISPPGGVWQDQNAKHNAGRAIYASDRPAYCVFLVFNTFSFSTSVLVILMLTRKFPLRVEVILATISMVVTYAFAIFAVTPRDHNARFAYVFLSGFMPFLFRGLIQIVPACYPAKPIEIQESPSSSPDWDAQLNIEPDSF